MRAATAVALIGGSAIAGTVTATADPGTGSSADINTLASTLSKGYGLNNCQPAQLSGPPLAELDCGQSPDANGPAAGVYQPFSNGTDLAAAFTGGINGVSLSVWGQRSITGHMAPGQFRRDHGTSGVRNLQERRGNNLDHRQQERFEPHPAIQHRRQRALPVVAQQRLKQFRDRAHPGIVGVQRGRPTR